MMVIDSIYLWLTLGGAAVMAGTILKAIAIGSRWQAGTYIAEHRKLLEQKKLDRAAAEAFGRAAGLEPLVLKSDGSIEEPILASVET